MRCKYGVRAVLSSSSCKGSKWWHGGHFVLTRVSPPWISILGVLSSLQRKEGWCRGGTLCWCVVRCLMFVGLCIWAFIKLINRILVHKFQIKSGMITADKWHKIKSFLPSGWLICSWEEKGKRLVFMFSRLVAFLPPCFLCENISVY